MSFIDDPYSLLASATDLLNTWAREFNVTEDRDERNIKNLINRLRDHSEIRKKGLANVRYNSLGTRAVGECPCGWLVVSPELHCSECHSPVRWPSRPYPMTTSGEWTTTTYKSKNK